MNDTPRMPILTMDFVEPDPWDEKWPRPIHAVVREVDIRTSGKQIDLGFSRSSKLLDVSTPTKLSALFKLVGSGKYDFENPGNCKPNRGEPPLAANNEDLCYVVYTLSDKNWQFTDGGCPITIEQSAKAACFEAHHIDSTGNLKLPPKDDCRAAYIISDPSKADDPNDFRHRINLHVDLMFEDANGKPTVRVPILIDPDIRHPGGADPEP